MLRAGRAAAPSAPPAAMPVATAAAVVAARAGGPGCALPLHLRSRLPAQQRQQRRLCHSRSSSSSSGVISSSLAINSNSSGGGGLLVPSGATTTQRRPSSRPPFARSGGVAAAAAAAAAAGSAGDDLPGPHDPAAALQLSASGPLPGPDLHADDRSLRARVRRARRRLAASAASPYDAELFALALPALASMLLDPIMNVISACEPFGLLLLWTAGRDGGGGMSGCVKNPRTKQDRA